MDPRWAKEMPRSPGQKRLCTYKALQPRQRMVAHLIRIWAVPADGAAAAIGHTGCHGWARSMVNHVQRRCKASLAARSLAHTSTCM